MATRQRWHGCRATDRAPAASWQCSAAHKRRQAGRQGATHNSVVWIGIRSSPLALYVRANAVLLLVTGRAMFAIPSCAMYCCRCSCLTAVYTHAQRVIMQGGLCACASTPGEWPASPSAGRSAARHRSACHTAAAAARRRGPAPTPRPPPAAPGRRLQAHPEGRRERHGAAVESGTAGRCVARVPTWHYMHLLELVNAICLS